MNSSFLTNSYAERYLKKLIGNTDLEDALRRLDTLSQEEAQMASAELLRITHSVDDKVVGVDNKLTGVDDRVQGVSSQVRGVDCQVQGIGEKMDRASRSLSPTCYSHLGRLRLPYRKPASR